MSIADLERRATVLGIPAEVMPRTQASERRDPRAATQPLRWVTPGRAQPPDWDSAQAFQYGVYSNVVVFACFEAIANTIASLPFRVGPDPENPTNYDAGHPLARMLNYKSAAGPNPEISAFDLWQYSIVQYLATGRFGWEIEQNGTQVAALWPLVSAALVPIPSERGNRYYSGFEYGRRDQPKKLKPDQIVYGWKPSGLDFRQPESALQAAHLDISIAVAQSRYDFAFLKNDARPAALIITEPFAKDADYQAFKDQWGANYGGVANAGKPAFVEAIGEGGVQGAVDVKVLGLSNKDTQAAQRYSDRLMQIAMALGVPWSRLDASGRTFDNASEEDKIWWTQKLVPLIRRLQSVVNIQLAPKFGNDVGWFDLSDVKVLTEAVNPVTASVGAPTMAFAQLMTINEARADYGLPPLADGDRMMTVEEINALRGVVQDPAISGAAVTEKPVTADLTPEDLAELEDEEKADAQVEAARSAELVKRAEVRRRLANGASQKRQDRLIRFWDGEWSEFFERQGRAVISRLKSNRGRRAVAGKEERGPADEVFDNLHWLDATMKLSRKMVIASAEDGTDDYLGRFGIDFDLHAPGVESFVDQRVNKLAGQVNDTTYTQIRAALNEGIGLGESIPDLSKRLEHVFDVTKSRATTIARTEVISAYNGAATSRAAELPEDVVAGQEWLATFDARTRDEHAGADGQVVAVSEAFEVGGEPLQYPGDPNGSPENVINCRCTVAFLTPEEFAERAPTRMAAHSRARALLRLIHQGVEVDARSVRIALEAA